MTILDGAIRIETVPDGASVYINGNLVGTSPLDITDVPPGKYKYSIQIEQYNIANELIVYPKKITLINTDFPSNTKNEKYIDIKKPLPPIPIRPTIQRPILPTIQQPTLPTTPSQLPTTDESTNINSNILQVLSQINSSLANINKNIQKTTPRDKIGTYDRITNILNSVPNSPNDTGSGLYQFELIHDTLGVNAETIYVMNVGPGLLYVITSSNGRTFTQETLILEGEHKEYNDVHTIGLRSPTLNLEYRVSERMVMSTSSERFSGSRFRDRRDKKGVVLFKDEYESATTKFIPTLGGGTITRSNDTSYSEDFSLKLITAAPSNSTSTITYALTDFHQSKLGAQIRFAGIPTNTAYFLAIDIILLGPVHYLGQILLSVTSAGASGLNTANVSYVDITGKFVQVLTNISLVNEMNVWHVIKLVIDISKGFYISFNIDGTEIDLSDIKLELLAPLGLAEVEIDITVVNFNFIGIVPSPTTLYFDDFIFTEDESQFMS